MKKHILITDIKGVERTLQHPISYSEVTRGWSIDSNGNGDYLGTSTMFGGVSIGDIIKIPTQRPYYLIVTWYSQNWDVRKAKGVKLCFCDEYWKIAKQQGLTQN